MGPMAASPEKLLLAAPRGYCAGVDRAVVTVEKALELYGAPVYVRKEIVHNRHVVSSLQRRGAIFVDDVLVVHDLLADVDRLAIEVECVLDGLHGAIDARAVPARSGQQDPRRARMARF